MFGTLVRRLPATVSRSRTLVCKHTPVVQSVRDFTVSSIRLSDGDDSKSVGGRNPSAKVLKLVDEIAELNLIEVTDLVETLREKLGLPAEVMGMGMPMQGFAMPAGGAPAAAAAEEAPAAAEKKEFDVKLKSFDAKNKIKVIKEVRAVTGLGLKEAKDLVEGVPAVLKKGLKKEEAEEIMNKLKEAGAEIVLE